jgi:hypothetical protein
MAPFSQRRGSSTLGSLKLFSQFAQAFSPVRLYCGKSIKHLAPPTFQPVQGRLEKFCTPLAGEIFPTGQMNLPA